MNLVFCKPKRAQEYDFFLQTKKAQKNIYYRFQNREYASVQNLESSTVAPFVIQDLCMNVIGTTRSQSKQHEGVYNLCRAENFAILNQHE